MFRKKVFKIARPVTLQSLLQSSFSTIDQVMIGQLGGKSIAGIGLGGKFASLYSIVLASVASAALIMVSPLYVRFYNVGTELRELTKKLLIVYAVVAPVKIQNMILGGGIIRSGGKTKYIMWIDMAGTWIFGVPLGVFAAFFLKMPVTYVYFILSLEECVRLAASLVIFRKRVWMKSL